MTLLEARDLSVTFRLQREGDMPWSPPRLLHAVTGVNFTLDQGETLGIELRKRRIVAIRDVKNCYVKEQ